MVSEAVDRQSADEWPTVGRLHTDALVDISASVIGSVVTTGKRKVSTKITKQRGKKNRLTLSFNWIPTKFGADGFIKFGAKRLEA